MSELIRTSMCHSNYFLDEVINMVVKSTESADSSKQAGGITFPRKIQMIKVCFIIYYKRKKIILIKACFDSYML